MSQFWRGYLIGMIGEAIFAAVSWETGFITHPFALAVGPIVIAVVWLVVLGLREASK